MEQTTRSSKIPKRLKGKPQILDKIQPIEHEKVNYIMNLNQFVVVVDQVLLKYTQWFHQD